MKIYRKTWKQNIHADFDEVWSFFSRPENLNVITPENMKFEILSDMNGVKMYPGILIDYKVSPFPLVSMNWQTEITEIEHRKKFVDEQRKGPYKLWRHQHIFTDKGDHIEMEDILEYALPFGVLGQLVNSLLVSRRIDQIFEYRYKKINEIFNNSTDTTPLFV
ncbi:MAG: SRPBCC family protein [Saprospiraceae bacterium]|nr:SRPBCC family protein [Saprospiraceae bacterium]